MKKFFIIIKYLISLGLLYLIFKNYGNDFLRLIQVIELKYIAIVIVISILQYIFSAYRWMYISKFTNLEISFSYSLKFYYISNFLNNVLPGGILGDLYRIYHTSEDKRKLIELGKSFQSVLFERLSGQLVLFIVFLTSLTFYFLFYEKYVAFFYLLLMMSIIIIIGKLLLRKKFKNFFKRNIFGKNFSSIFSGSIFWQHFFYSFFVISSYISIYVITALSLKLNIDYFSFLVFTPLILFSMSIPISVGGWGVREVTALLVSFLLGLSASASVTVSIVYGLLNFLCSLPGLIFMYYMPTR
tara:strand:- start:1560 stop:2456 length:897 start_codon:yes stop_codon:yes gene_type:complete